MKKALRPKRSKGFRDKYLAPVMIAAAFLMNACASAQQPVDTTKPLQAIYANGYDYFNGFRVRGYLIIPNDTPKLRVEYAGAIAYTFGSIWSFDGYNWYRSVGSDVSKFDDSTIVINGDTVRFGSGGGVSVINTTKSITKGTGDSLQLVNDLQSPGANMGYKTNGAGVKGWYIDTASGSGGGQQDWINITLAQLDVGMGLDSNKIYYVTDKYKEGPFRNAGLVANQTTDDGGLRVVDAGLRAWDRINPSNEVNAWWYGVVPDGKYVSGNYGTGTNSSPGLQKAIVAANGRRVNVFGNVYLPDVVDTAVTLNIPYDVKFWGNTYQAGNDLLILRNYSGPFEQHYVEHLGYAYGKVNLPTHSKATYDANTDPDWWALTSTFVKIYNTSQCKVVMNYATGFYSPVQVLVDGRGGAYGSQENLIIGRKFTGNNITASIVLLKGQGYADKNKWFVERMSGNICYHVDGYGDWTVESGVTYNGSVTSNEIHGLVELSNIGILTNGNNTSPVFDINWEGGTLTNLFSDTMAYCTYGGLGGKSNMIAPQYVGGGLWGLKHIKSGTNQLGKFARIEKPGILNGADLLSTSGKTLDDGLMVYLTPSRRTLPEYTRAAAMLVAPNVRFTNEPGYEATVKTTSRFFTIPPDTLRTLIYNYTVNNGTIYFPLSATSVDRLITIFNDSASTVAISAVPGFTALPKGMSMTFWNPGTGWRAVHQLPNVGAGTGDMSSTVSSATDGQLFVANGITAKSFKPFTATGPLKSASGVVSAGAINLASEVTGLLPIANINASGTPSSTTYLRGDGTWGTPAGGGGGSSPLVAGSGTGTPYYYSNGPLNIGANPAQSYAWTHWGASTSSRAIWEFSGSSVFPSVQRAHSIAYNGSNFRWVDAGGFPWLMMFENTAGTFTNASWNANDIGPEFIDIGTSAKGDILESNGVDGARIVKPREQLLYSQTAAVSITNTTTATSLFTGGAKTYTNYNYVAGDIIEIESNGLINNLNSSGGGIEWTLAINGYTYSIPALTSPDYLIVGKSMHHRLIIQYRGTGSSVTAAVTWYIQIGNEQYIRQPILATGVSTVSPVINLTGKWSSASASNNIQPFTTFIKASRLPAP